MIFHKWTEATPCPSGWEATCGCGGVMPLDRGQWDTGCARCGTNYTVDWQSSASSALDWALKVAARYQ